MLPGSREPHCKHVLQEFRPSTSTDDLPNLRELHDIFPLLTGSSDVAVHLEATCRRWKDWRGIFADGNPSILLVGSADPYQPTASL